MTRLIILLNFLTFAVHAQTDYGFELNGGANRIGLYAGTDFRLNVGSNRLNIGLRIYPQSSVLEKMYPGYSVSYMYALSASSWSFGPALRLSYFHERKETLSMNLWDISLGFKLYHHFTQRWSWYSALGTGPVMNYSLANDTGVRTNLNYFNYEISAGFSFILSDVVDN